MEGFGPAILNPILEDLKSKAVFLSGPRQVGKTTLSKSLSQNCQYFNFDIPKDRVSLLKREWHKENGLLILDEIHKMKNWKAFLKGIVDNKNEEPPLLVTGSARLDTARKVGDSLAGRFFSYRLNPLDLKQCKGMGKPKEILSHLLETSGFPEPFLKGQKGFYKRWSKTHLDIIIRQDLIDLESIRDISSIELLIELLRTRVGSPISYASLARDIQRDATTIKRWIQVLENLFIVFRVIPFHKNISRAILKEPKIYFYDTATVEGEGARLENLVAFSLRKELDLCEDLLGERTALHYVRTKEGKEIDFLILIGKKPVFLIEVKSKETDPSPQWNTFLSYFPEIPKVQLVKEIQREWNSPNQIKIRDLANWLTNELNFIDPFRS